jgi:hypothetical protein
MSQRFIKKAFCYGLLALTLVPMAFFIFLGDRTELNGTANVKWLLVIAGSAHVPATLTFYADRGFRQLAGDHLLRYAGVPFALIIGSGIFYASANALGQSLFNCAYWLWLIWHYGRQNIGVNAFLSIGATGKAPHPNERRLITFGVVAGMLGIMEILAANALPQHFRPFLSFLYGAGFVLFIPIGLATLAYLFSFRKDITPLKAASLLTCVFFFAPMYLAEGINGKFLSYAIAHACQYLMFMSVTAAGLSTASGQFRFKFLAVAVMLLFAGFVGWGDTTLFELKKVTDTSTPSLLLDFLVGTVLGFTMSHFVVDAGIWRLSQRPQRELLTKKFAFILGPGGS